MAVPTTDPLAPLLELAGVAEAFAEARAAVDRALGHRALRRQGGPLAAEAALVAAQASAALEGSDFELEEIRGGTVTDPVVQGALRVTEAVPRLADQWPRAPLQVLAKLHVFAARGLAAEPELGRPTGAAAPDLSARLDALAKLVAGATSAPALLVAAIVHAELLAVRPFATANGVVARAAARLTLVERGLDPRALIVPEVGHLARQPEYVGAAGAYATGTPDGLRSWLRHYATAVSLGAEQTVTIAGRLTG
ncbi:MAG: oxidoreductase [Micromonosporaceae bacterium]